MLDWSQWLYVVLLASALLVGRPRALVAIAMVGNFAGTVAFSGDFIAVGICDAASIAILMAAGRMGMILAALFVLMIPAYLAGYAFALPPHATYAIVDLIAFLQLAVICGLGGGTYRRIRLGIRRGFGGGVSMAQGGSAYGPVSADIRAKK
jgi:hypothetical protein